MFVALKISHKFDVARFLESLVRVDPPNQTSPIAATKTVDRYGAWHGSVESPAIPRIAKTIRR